jgi:hypothetical protein
LKKQLLCRIAVNFYDFFIKLYMPDIVMKNCIQLHAMFGGGIFFIKDGAKQVYI